MSRGSRVTADITLEAHNLLRDYCKKHERSKGYLLEKMIRKFCGVDVADTDVADIKQPTEIAAVKKPVKRFAKPYLIDVDNYMVEKGCLDPCAQADKFWDFYESNGWKVGKNKMKCWQAAVRNWLKGNSNERFNGNNKSTGQKKSAVERVNERNNLKYGQPDECGLGVGPDGGHMGGTMDEGKRGATIEYVDNEPFVDY